MLHQVVLTPASFGGSFQVRFRGVLGGFLPTPPPSSNIHPLPTIHSSGHIDRLSGPLVPNLDHLARKLGPSGPISRPDVLTLPQAAEGKIPEPLLYACARAKNLTARRQKWPVFNPNRANPRCKSRQLCPILSSRKSPFPLNSTTTNSTESMPRIPFISTLRSPRIYRPITWINRTIRTPHSQPFHSQFASIPAHIPPRHMSLNRPHFTTEFSVYPSI